MPMRRILRSSWSMPPGVYALLLETMAAASTNNYCNPDYSNTGDSRACASDRRKLVRNSASGAGIWPVRRSNYPFQAVLRLAARDHLGLRSEVVGIQQSSRVNCTGLSYKPLPYAED